MEDPGGQSIQDGGVPQPIQNVRKYHRQAYDHISKALKIDEGEGKILYSFSSSILHPLAI